jgi:hypothetical protein
MKHALTGLLLAGSTCAFLLATPAIAQVAGNPGDQHTPTLHTNEAQSQVYGTATPGFGGALGPLGILAAPNGGGPSGGACGVSQDFNGRLTALCGL